MVVCLALGQHAGATPITPVTIDFGVSWPDYSDIGAGNYATSPYDLVRGVAKDNNYANESDIAELLNLVVKTSFIGTDIDKTDTEGNFVELFDGTEKEDGYFLVPAGWNYLVAQYGGPQGGGSVVVQLSGNDAKVPFDSSSIWGSGDKYAVSHYSVAGPIDITNLQPPAEVPRAPDGGTTAAMLGLSLLGMGFMARRKSKS